MPSFGPVFLLSSIFSLPCIHRTVGETVESDDLDKILESYWVLHNSRTDLDASEHHRHVRECQQIKYGNLTSSSVMSYKVGEKDVQSPLVESRYTFQEIGPYYPKKTVFVHHTVVNYPYQTLSVLEPLQPGGCHGDTADRATVANSAKQKDCFVAINAGLFNTTSGACLGNVVSDGRLVQDSGGIQNAHFGIKSNGELFFGYLSEIELVAEDFLQLVGGVIWLVRNGEVYVQESLKMECSDTQETGTLNTFANIISARTAVGVDKKGRVILVQIDGQSYKRGVTLEEFANLLLSYDIVDAINLDGGGSATYVINGTVVNYPSDTCQDDRRFHCPRNVSTILCVHEPACDPEDCSGHGKCVMGKCTCTTPWSGSACDTLQCQNDCSSHGRCSPDGCMCEAGWHGDDCSQPCLPGNYGKGCVHECACLHGATCSSVDGTCNCTEGYTGQACEKACPFGYYGNNCKQLCLCQDGCPCHPISGSCNFTDLDEDLTMGGQCYAKEFIKENHLVPDQSEDYRLMQIGFVILGVIATLSAISNIFLLYKLATKTDKTNQATKYKAPQMTKSRQMFLFQGVSTTEDDLSSLSEYSHKETSFTSNNSKHLNNTRTDMKELSTNTQQDDR